MFTWVRLLLQTTMEPQSLAPRTKSRIGCVERVPMALRSVADVIPPSCAAFGYDRSHRVVPGETARPRACQAASD